MRIMDKCGNKIKIIFIIIIAVAIFLICNCCFDMQMKRVTSKNNVDELTIYTPHPISFVKPIVEEYERRTKKTVKVIYGGTGALIQELESGTQIDAMWGGSYYSAIGYSDLFEDYWTPNELYFREDNKNTEGNMTRFTDMPSVLIINTDLIGNIEVGGYMDLLNDDLKGNIAFADPTKSSSSFEQLINIIYACRNIGIDEWEYMRKLCSNLNGNLLKSSQDVYNGVADGKYIVGLTFEEAALSKIADGKPVKIVYMEEGVVSTPDGIYLLKKAVHKKEAEEFINFLTGYDAQYMISTQLRRRSVRRDVPTANNIPSKDSINLLNPVGSEIVNNKEAWLAEFKRIFEEESR